MEKNKLLMETLILLAQKKSSMDDFNADDGGTPNYYCGNFDDCYSMGCEDGQISMARTILKQLGIDWSTTTPK